MTMRILTLVVILVFHIFVIQVDGYETPTPRIEALKPRGFRVSIPDSPGVQLFAFHGNINKEFEGNEAGQYSVDILRERNGRWTYRNPTATLNPGDTLHFWTHVRVDGRGYEKFFQEYHVPDDSSGGAENTVTPCREGPLSIDIRIGGSEED